MKRPLLLLVVAVSGAAVLSLELLGTRLLGPFYGVSLFLWSALISVTLAALSVGYALGGRMADRGADGTRLATLLLAAGAWTLLAPVLRDPVLIVTGKLGLRVAVLVASLTLFFVPLALLGMVTPIAVRLRTHSLADVGSSAGEVYAVSTLASVGSALLTGFVLIPQVGAKRLLLLLGGLLVLTAALVYLSERRRAPAAAALLALLGIGACWRLTGPNPKHLPDLLSVRQSAYGEIRVVNEDEDYRYLILDGGTHSLVRIGQWDSRHAYVAAAELVRNFFPGPGTMLTIGMGAGTLAKSYHRAGWAVDVAEIDPAIPEVARRYFDLRPADARITIADGRRFLAERPATGQPARYDFIMIDAFGSSFVPFHLLSREAFALAAARLTSDGVLALNLITTSWDDILARSVAATLKTSFRHVIALPNGEPPNTLGNIVMLASNREMTFPEDTIPNPYAVVADEYLHWKTVEQNHCWDNRFEPNTDGAPVLTDDRSPVDLWGERVNLAVREDLHGYFKNKGLDW